MNFTREPIIETVITPKEGNKLIVKSSKSDKGEEYLVDAVEVVSFGQALFFRSIERPKAFLVPIGDYEVVEGKEIRQPLKTTFLDKTVKIGGGKEASTKKENYEKEEAGDKTENTAPSFVEGEETGNNPNNNNKRDHRRRRRRRGGKEREENSKMLPSRPPIESNSIPSNQGETSPENGKENAKEAVISPPTFSQLIPPPTKLISESLKKYKETVAPIEEENKENPPAAEASAPLERRIEQPLEVSPYFFSSEAGWPPYGF